MRAIVAWISVGVLSIFSVMSFFYALDAGLWIDGLTSQVKLQREALDLLQAIANQSFRSCTITVSDLKEISGSFEYEVFLYDKSFGVGTFQGKIEGSCIKEIRFI